MDSNEYIHRALRESPASGLKKLDKKFSISLDNAFRDGNNVVTISCSEIEKKPSSKPSFEKSRDETSGSLNLLEELEQRHREHIADLCAESGRTQEWIETALEYKNDHYKCEMCGGTLDIEAHDILPYRLLTEDQRHDRVF
jgi:hypothetical protein